MIVLFQGARHVIKADKLCRENGLSTTIVPVPERFSSECGMCMRFEETHRQQVSTLLTNAQIIFQIEDDKE